MNVDNSESKKYLENQKNESKWNQGQNGKD